MSMPVRVDQAVQNIQAALHNERWGDAEALINQALGQRPDDPLLQFFAGNLFVNTQRYGMAIPLLKNLVTQQPEMYEAWANLGGALRREHKVGMAREALTRALQLSPDNPSILANLTACFVNEGDPECGEQFARRALEVAPDTHLASWNLALLLLEQAKWEEGFERYAQNENTKQRLYRTYEAGKKTPVLYELDDLADDQVVVVHGEQGIGDEVMFASILPDFIKYRTEQAMDRGLSEANAALDTRIILESHSRLEDIFRRSFPNIEVNGTRDQEYLTWANDREVHWSCPIGNLGKFFRQRESHFMDHAGYLKPNFELSRLYRRQLELAARGLPIIGFAWSGGVKSTQAEYRTIDLVDLEPLLSQKALFVSMQYRDDEFAVDEFELHSGIRIERFPQAAQASNVDKVVALAQACDLVITVNNSLHHFCGAIGQQCWTMTPKGCAWRYAPTDWDRAIWYPNTSKMFRQGGDKQWGPVIDKVADALDAWLRKGAKP